MRNCLVLSFFLAVASLNWACSSGSVTNKQVDTSAPGANKTASLSNLSQTSSSDTNPVNSVTNVQTGTFAQPPNNKKVEDMPADGRPILRWEPAAEDSQITSAMNASGQMYESRIFKRHPQLVKVDATWINPKEKSLKIVLRNGRVMDVTTDKIVNLKLATAAQILELVGIEPVKSERNKTGAKQAK